MGDARQFPHIIDAAGEIAGEVQSQQFGALAQHQTQRLRFDAPTVGIEGNPAHHQAKILRRLQPGGDIAFMVHAGDQNLVSRGEHPPQSPGHVIGDFGHGGAQRDFIGGSRSQQQGGICVGLAHNLLGAVGSREMPAQIGTGIPGAGEDGVQHHVRHLRAGRVVKKDRGGAP